MSSFRYTRPDNFPPVVKNLLILNGLVFVAQLIFENQGTNLLLYGGLVNWRYDEFKPYQFFTHMFMHGDFFHILFNMFGLWMFGRILETVMGPRRFLLLYFISGIAAALLQQIMGGFLVAIGASGAVMGVFAAFAYLFPNTELFFMFIPVPVKAKYAIPGLMALDLFGAISKVPGDNVAHWAHLGGAAAGFLLVLFWNKTNRNSFY